MERKEGERERDKAGRAERKPREERDNVCVVEDFLSLIIHLILK